MIRRLIEIARAQARERGGELRAVHVRLGALAGGTPGHLREHFAIELAALGLAGIELHVVAAPDEPTGVEITGIEVTACEAADRAIPELDR